MRARAPRVIAGAIVLLILIVLGVILVPPYAQNWKLQSYITALADDPSTSLRPEQDVRFQVASKAKSLGLPVNAGDVHVAKSPGATKIDVLYIMQMNVAGYAVDLHFRPQTGS